MLIEQNEKLLKKMTAVEDNIEVMSESIDTLVQIQTNQIMGD